MSVCTIRGCDRKLNAKGLCGPHYTMWKRHGDARYADKGLHLATLGRKGNTVKDFWESVRKTRGCWWWLLAKDKDGYGFFWYKNKQIRAHRFVAEFVLMLEIDGLQVCHKCDNPSCVNPKHLFVGTNQDNMDDRDSKGRNVRGERCHNAVVTAKRVREIRVLGTTKISHRKIGERFGLSRPQVSAIIRREKWKHVV